MEHVNNIACFESVSSVLEEMSGSIAGFNKAHENKLVNRVHRLEAVNAHLEDLVEAGTKKLSEAFIR